MRALLFPGQGSQKKGMGGDLFDTVAEYRAAEPEVDALLGYSMRRLCLDDTDGRLRRTEFTQPALYVVNALHYYAGRGTQARSDFVAGHSLGEYNALLAAGAFDFLTGLRLVQKRGALMAEARDGGMAAVVGLAAAAVTRTLRNDGFVTLDVANYNSPVQTVISGPVADIARAQPALEQAGADMVLPLQVSAAFHSRYMEPAARAFADYLEGVTFAVPTTPVISNVSALPYPTSGADAAIRIALVQQITHPVLWSQTIRYLLDRKVDGFVEVGPGQVLTKLVRAIREPLGL